MANLDDETFDLTSAMQQMIAAMKDAAAGTTQYSAATAQAIAISEQEREAAKAQKKLDDAAAAAKKKLTAETDKVSASFKKLGSELLSIANAGVKFGSMIGTTATKGVEIEIKNRVAVASQLLNFNANLAVTVEQLKAAQTGFADVFIGAREGMQISAKGSLDFVQSLKKGFKSEFEPTAETFRMLTQMGMSTTEQFDSFRKATGRASLSNSQLSTLYNKNTLSFLLYGKSFAGAAVNAERLGVSLASVQAAQEGLVTNLDGTIDTVAQINQLGGQIDFGSLIRVAEQDGPDALMAYVKATVPANLMQSASTRALFKQLGISVEDYLKSGDDQMSAAQKMENQMSEAASETNKTTKVLGALGSMASKISSILTGSFGTLSWAALQTASALRTLAQTQGGPGTIGRGIRRGLGATAGVGIGIGATMLGQSMVAEGNMAGGMATGIAGGALGGALSGGMMGGLPGAIAGALIGGTMAGMNAYSAKANDLFSSGYGDRTLVSSKGAYSLNNSDTIVAGTNLFPKGQSGNGGGNAELVRKIDALISTLANANTTINVGGTMQTVSRMQLVGVYSRNERT